MPRLTQLLVIDPQNDFCDLPAAAGRAPALPVAGADADLRRVAALIDAAGAAIDAITVTLDTHQRVDIAHPPFWQQADGSEVAPFTTITAAQLRAGAFRPRDPAALPRAQAYVDALEARGRYTLMVWPVHCEIGGWGQQVHAGLAAACARWTAAQGRRVVEVTKGENPWTEHYSAVQAEVPLAGDAGTQLNTALIAALDRAELLLIAGEAGSHCVRATTEHIVDHLPGGRLERVVLLTDCMSPVPGFEAQQRDFLAAMQARGVRLTTAAEALALLQAR
ncbi:MAG: isochorismatase family protein [Pelomonas sp.]|nr:isochorismatase family protein [Roseateles sp.]